MMPRMLLKSWATPPARIATASFFFKLDQFYFFAAVQLIIDLLDMLERASNGPEGLEYDSLDITQGNIFSGISADFIGNLIVIQKVRIYITGGRDSNQWYRFVTFRFYYEAVLDKLSHTGISLQQ